MQNAVKVLLFCPKPPWPSTDGGAVATARLAEGLADRGAAVEVVALTTPEDVAADAPPDGVTMTTVAVDSKPRGLSLAGNLVRHEPYQLRRFYDGSAFEVVNDRLTATRAEILQLDGAGVLSYLPNLRAAFRGVIVYRALTVENRLFRVRMPPSAGPVTWWWKRQADRLERVEHEACAAVDGVAAVSESVAEWCRPRAGGPVAVIGVGARAAPSGAPAAGRKDLVHLGSMDRWSNRDGIGWFLTEVWPEVRRRHPRLEFHLAGRGSAKLSRKFAADGVVVDGEIEDPAAYLAEHGPVIVPLRAGSGLRVKIVEAMALGKAIIASPAAVGGLDVEPGRHLLTAEDPRSWLHVIDRCLDDRDLVAAVGAEARMYAEAHFSPQKLSDDLLGFYAGLNGSAPDGG